MDNTTMRFAKLFQRGLARTLDNASFGAINLLQRRHALSVDFPEEMQTYVRRWERVDLEDYYCGSSRGKGAAFTALDHAARQGGTARFASPLASPFAANNRATFVLSPSGWGWDGPTMMVSHGLMSAHDLGYRLWARVLNSHGWNAIFVHLPYHYSRCPAGYWTGELAVSANLIRTVEGVRQAVVEARLVLDWLEQRGCRLTGLWGTSYGGWIGALLAGIEARLHRLILVEPILDIQEAIWHSPATIGLRSRLHEIGITPELTKPHLRLCCPSQLQPKLKPEHIIMVAGEYDQIAPPHPMRALQQRWSGAHGAVFPQGHMGYRLMRESFRLARELWPADFAVAEAVPVTAKIFSAGTMSTR